MRSQIYPYCVFNLYKQLPKMQPSIKMFFKSKQSTQVDKAQQDNCDKGDEKVSTPTKRTADQDDDVEDSKTLKRQAISSPTDASTPTKSVKKISDDDENVKKDNMTEVTTPKKVENKIAPSTPLINLNIVIKKKIVSGAFALHENIGHTWFRALQDEFEKPYFKKLSNFVLQERRSKTVYPPEDKVYTWTHNHEIRETRVIIIGQDPYHRPNQAHGLSFSVQKGVQIPPSLINIYKELESDIEGFKAPKYGDLSGWSKQGVLMLNACLTVNAGQANSHQNKGWETFTDTVISWISKNIKHKVVFMLWGRPAQRKSNLIDKRHKVLTAAHPSPLSAHNGFFGCRHFSQTNSFLKSQGLPEIDWKAL